MNPTLLQRQVPRGARDDVALSHLRGLSAVCERLFDGRDAEAILSLSLSALASLGCFRSAAAYLVRDDVPVRHGGCGARPDEPGTTAAVQALGGREGALDLPGCAWSWAYALRGPEGCDGYLVVRASTVPSLENRLMAKALARQAEAALSSVTTVQRERARVAELRRQHAAQARANAELQATVGGLERRGAITRALAQVSISDEGEEGIVRVLHERTGLAAVSEDPFGNLRAWAGPGRPDPYPEPPAGHRAEVLRRAGGGRGPVRDRDRLLLPAQQHGEVLGVLALVDPEHRAAGFEAFVLEQAATVLALELSHVRRLAEAELRMRSDLVEDLVTGTDEESAYARSEALCHDLHGTHRAAVVRWTGFHSDETVTAAIGRAAAGGGLDFLLGRRSGAIVLLLRGENVSDTLYEAIARVLGSPAGAIGVGGPCESPVDLPRSYREAQRALDVRRNSRTPEGLTTFDEIGIYRLLGTGDGDHGAVEQFVHEWLGSLVEYDRVHHTDLVTTLAAYLDAGGAYEASAAALMIHRSTLRYRLQRIRQITGRDLTDVEVRLNLHVATRIWQFVS
jgi:DNA-binding PucR family transcriptional regulator